MKKGTILADIRVDSLGYGGVGVATLSDGKKVLIKGALPNSVVDVKVIKSKKDYIQAHIVAVKNIAPELTTGEVRCPHYIFPYHQESGALPAHKVGCGGCKRQVVTYETQLSLKQSIVSDCFGKLIRDYPDLAIGEVMPSPQIYQYRNKIEFSFGKFLQRGLDKSVEGFKIAEHWNLGMHKQGEFSKVIDVDQCFLISDRMHQVFETLKELCKSSGLPVYDAKTHEGFFRHMVIREGVNTEQMMVLLSVAPQYLQQSSSAKQRRSDLTATCKEHDMLRKYVSTFVINETDQLADAVAGKETQQSLLWGTGSIFEKLRIGDTESTFQISPFSFFQTNTRGAEVLFETAKNMLIYEPDTIIDLYCGSGTIGLSFLNSGLGKTLIGVDIVPSAIYDAHKNAQINNVQQQATFYVGKAEKIVYEHLSGVVLSHKDLVVVDPPREGMHPDTVSFLLELALSQKFQLCYISCNPKTMARDIELLVAGGLHLHQLQPVDMFPHTHHIETVGLLASD